MSKLIEFDNGKLNTLNSSEKETEFKTEILKASANETDSDSEERNIGNIDKNNHEKN